MPERAVVIYRKFGVENFAIEIVVVFGPRQGKRKFPAQNSTLTVNSYAKVMCNWRHVRPTTSSGLRWPCTVAFGSFCPLTESFEFRSVPVQHEDT